MYPYFWRCPNLPKTQRSIGRGNLYAKKSARFVQPFRYNTGVCRADRKTDTWRQLIPALAVDAVNWLKVKVKLGKPVTAQCEKVEAVTPREGCEVLWCVQYICCLPVRWHISKTIQSDFTKFSVYVDCGSGLVLLWQQQRCDTLCNSSFLDHLTFPHNETFGTLFLSGITAKLVHPNFIQW